MEQAIISAVVSDQSEAKLTVAGVPDRPGVAARLFRALADELINVDMIEQNVSMHGTTDISFTVPHDGPGHGQGGHRQACRTRSAPATFTPTPTSPPSR